MRALLLPGGAGPSRHTDVPGRYYGRAAPAGLWWLGPGCDSLLCGDSIPALKNQLQQVIRLGECRQRPAGQGRAQRRLRWLVALSLCKGCLGACFAYEIRYDIKKCV